jgi:hypothetical protein
LIVCCIVCMLGHLRCLLQDLLAGLLRALVSIGVLGAVHG